MTQELEVMFERISFCFETRKFADLRILLLDMEPADIALFMEDNLNEKEQLMFFRILPKELASDVFVEIDTDLQEILIKAFTDKELKAVIDDMYLDDTVDVIEEMPANVVKRILQNSTPEDRKQINELLEYPEDSAGSIMTTEFISFSPSTTIESAFEKIRRTGVNKETIYTCYVVDRKKRLVGVVSVKDMLLAETNALIADVMDSNAITVETLEDKEQVALKFSKYDFLALPVIDREGCLVGIVTVDDAVDVIQEEATEDIQKMAAVLPNEKPYLKQSVFSTWKARVPWLILLLITSTFTSLILASYEQKLNKISTVLLAFVPMLMGTAGNAGGQTSVTIIRALAVGEIEFKDIFKVMLKELLVSLCIGLTVGVICFAKIMLLDNLYSTIALNEAFVISLVCSISLIMAKLVGCILPLFAKKIRLDPAVVASPLMTTIVDALALIIYCTISLAIL
ncbi:MAG: magnesium transporter [Clostridiales bacterium]|nr:magnesium transporter [Clostridiales bacterium]